MQPFLLLLHVCPPFSLAWDWLAQFAAHRARSCSSACLVPSHCLCVCVVTSCAQCHAHTKGRQVATMRAGSDGALAPSHQHHPCTLNRPVDGFCICWVPGSHLNSACWEAGGSELRCTGAAKGCHSTGSRRELLVSECIYSVISGAETCRALLSARNQGFRHKPSPVVWQSPCALIGHPDSLRRADGSPTPGSGAAAERAEHQRQPGFPRGAASILSAPCIAYADLLAAKPYPAAAQFHRRQHRPAK